MQNTLNTKQARKLVNALIKQKKNRLKTSTQQKNLFYKSLFSNKTFPLTMCAAAAITAV